MISRNPSNSMKSIGQHATHTQIKQGDQNPNWFQGKKIAKGRENITFINIRRGMRVA